MKLFQKRKDTVRLSAEDRKLRRSIPFDPEKQVAVIRSSVCTGEKAAGFRDAEGRHFTEVMLIRSRQDEERFKAIYGLDSLKIEY